MYKCIIGHIINLSFITFIIYIVIIQRIRYPRYDCFYLVILCTASCNNFLRFGLNLCILRICQTITSYRSINVQVIIWISIRIHHAPDFFLSCDRLIICIQYHDRIIYMDSYYNSLLFILVLCCFKFCLMNQRYRYSQQHNKNRLHPSAFFPMLTHIHSPFYVKFRYIIALF